MSQETYSSEYINALGAGESMNGLDADMGTPESSRRAESIFDGIFPLHEQQAIPLPILGAYARSYQKPESYLDMLVTEPASQPCLPGDAVDLRAHPLRITPVRSLSSSYEPASSSIEELDSMDFDLPDERESQDSRLTEPSRAGPRFPSWVVRALKGWFSDHIRHPYPTAREMESIQRQTGLSRQQIANWLANTRRRIKSKRPRAPSPFVGLRDTHSNTDMSDPNESPVSFQHMDPLQRWQNSPPEHEAVDASALAQAISGLAPGEGRRSHDEDRDVSGSWHNALSTSSAGTSHSGRSSLASAYSQNSHASRRSFELPGQGSKRRRRRAAAARSMHTTGLSNLSQTSHTFQCTFCTETFKTKHSWQRHEKSLHLSLERWTCSPDGPGIKDPNTSRLACVFCAQLDPDEDHLQGHNYAICFGRLPEERIFYRKDHIRQHLKLVHNAKFIDWPMDLWKDESQIIRSRCGFCKFVMSHWSDRVDHLAEHFRQGKSMADWQGDWGFEDHVLDMVENSVPPYLIHYERNSPWPFTTKQVHPETPSNAFELIKLELEDFLTDHLNESQCIPSDEALAYESCCIVLSSDVLSQSAETTAPSWLRDLLTSSEETTKRARLRPMKNHSTSWVTQLKIHGKGNIFEACSMENQLQNYVEISTMLGHQVADSDLQLQAYSIVTRMEASSPHPCPWFQTFLAGLIYGSSCWLAPFRHRANLVSMVPQSAPRSNHSSEMQDIQATTSSHESKIPRLGVLSTGAAPEAPIGKSLHTVGTSISVPVIGSNHDGPKIPPRAMPLLLNDDNCYRRLVRDLSRFVVSTISPRNPDSHVPTDEELQYQARWIMFQDDDPWNQTPADNAEWLRQFKCDLHVLHGDVLSGWVDTSVSSS